MADTIRFPFFTSKPAPLPGAAEAVKVRKEKAHALAKRKADSFERCDTDGFLSQWADGLGSQREEVNAEIAAEGGYALFPCLFDKATGQPLRCAQKPSKFGGSYWLLGDEEAEKYGRRFVPFGSRSRVQKDIGLYQGEVWQPAKADFMGTGTGLSGRCWVAVFPTSIKGVQF